MLIQSSFSSRAMTKPYVEQIVADHLSRRRLRCKCEEPSNTAPSRCWYVFTDCLIVTGSVMFVFGFSLLLVCAFIQYADEESPTNGTDTRPPPPPPIDTNPDVEIRPAPPPDDCFRTRHDRLICKPEKPYTAVDYFILLLASVTVVALVIATFKCF